MRWRAVSITCELSDKGGITTDGCSGKAARVECNMVNELARMNREVTYVTEATGSIVRWARMHEARSPCEGNNRRMREIGLVCTPECASEVSKGKYAIYHGADS